MPGTPITMLVIKVHTLKTKNKAIYYSQYAINMLQPPGGARGSRGVHTMLQLTPDIQTTQLRSLVKAMLQYNPASAVWTEERNKPVAR
jgi:hypothetical protein